MKKLDDAVREPLGQVLVEKGSEFMGIGKPFLVSLWHLPGWCTCAGFGLTK